MDVCLVAACPFLTAVVPAVYGQELSSLVRNRARPTAVKAGTMALRVYSVFVARRTEYATVTQKTLSK